MIDLIVGRPVRNRTRILPLWKEHVEKSVPDDFHVSYVFVVGSDDTKTIDMLKSWKNTKIIQVEEPEIDDVRSWADTSRYEHMCFLRNTMLDYVRKQSPDLFLSLDSDILIHKDLICNLFKTVVECNADAVGGLTFFDPVDKTVTNVANWVKRGQKSGFRRIISTGVHQVDIIMGIKLMTQAAYNTDYQYHRMGEDLGWAVNMSDKKVYFNGLVTNKHIMSPSWLERKDKRIDW